MVTYEYAILQSLWHDGRKEYEWFGSGQTEDFEDIFNTYTRGRGRYLNKVGSFGWRIAHIQIEPGSPARTTYYLERRRDRYCTHCAEGIRTAKALEAMVPPEEDK